MVTDPRDALLKAIEENRQKDEQVAEETKKQKEAEERKAARQQGLGPEWSRLFERIQSAATRVNNDIAEQRYLCEVANEGERGNVVRAASVLLLRDGASTEFALRFAVDQDGMISPKSEGGNSAPLMKRDMFEFTEDDAYLLMVNLFVQYVKQRGKAKAPSRRTLV